MHTPKFTYLGLSPIEAKYSILSKKEQDQSSICASEKKYARTVFNAKRLQKYCFLC